MSQHDELEPYRAEFTAFCEHMEVGLKTRFPSLTQKEVLAVIGISLFAETQKLERDNAALMEDAARYRWLRDNGRLTYIWNSALHDFEKEGHNTVSETIDAAIAKDKT